MNEHDDDIADLEEAELALARARTSSMRTDALLARLRKTSAEISSTVQPNGYVSRFRQMLRGA